MLVKLESVSFLGLKMTQSTYLRKYTASQCSTLSACHRNSNLYLLVIMILIPVVLVDFRGRFKHVFVFSQHLIKLNLSI